MNVKGFYWSWNAFNGMAGWKTLNRALRFFIAIFGYVQAVDTQAAVYYKVTKPSPLSHCNERMIGYTKYHKIPHITQEDNMEILRCENVSKIYGKGETEVTALDKVSFTVEKGEFVSIIGPSGSGKSTLLHILGGVDKPTEGKVFIDGTDIHSLSEDKLAIFRRRQIGLVYQFYNLMPVLNIDENIALPHLLDGRTLDKERLDQVVEHLGLTDRRGNLPSQLSGGQQQRVSIGRALYSHPAILLADEPTGNLDRRTGEEIIELLKESNKKNKQTLLLITHDESLAMQADRIISIEDGRIGRNEKVRNLV